MTFQQLFQIIKQTFLIFCLKYHMKKTFSIVLENDRKTTLKVKQADCRRHYGLKIPYPLPQYLYPCSLCRKCHPQRVTLWAKILLIFKTFTIYPCSLSPNSCTRDKKKNQLSKHQPPKKTTFYIIFHFSYRCFILFTADWAAVLCCITKGLIKNDS